MCKLLFTLVATAVIAPTAHGAIDFVELLPEYEVGSLAGISADGSSLAILASDLSALRLDSHIWRGTAGWVLQPNPAADRNRHQSLSADGARHLISRDTGGLDLFKAET